MSITADIVRGMTLDMTRSIIAGVGVNPLVFHTSDDVDGVFNVGVIRGVGGLTEARTGSLWTPDDSSPPEWIEYATTVPCEHYIGGKWWLHGQKALTNSQIRSFNLADAEWTKSNMTAVLNAPGMRADANGGTTLTATAGNATCIANVITDASDDQTTRWSIKRLTGTGVINISVDGGSTWQDVTTEVDSTAGFNECLEDQAALTDPQIGIRIVTDTDAVIVGNAEAHLGDLKEAVRQAGAIFTEGSTISTNGTDLSFDDANHADISGLWICDFRNAGLNAANLSSILSLGTAPGRFMITDSGAARFRADDGPNTANGPAITLAADDTEYLNALAYGSGNMRVRTDSAWGVEQTYDGTFTSGGAIKVFRNSASTNLPIATMLIRNIRRYQLSYTAAIAKAEELSP